MWDPDDDFDELQDDFDDYLDSDCVDDEDFDDEEFDDMLDDMNEKNKLNAERGIVDPDHLPDEDE